jgi:hypothetical protein
VIVVLLPSMSKKYGISASAIVRVAEQQDVTEVVVVVLLLQTLVVVVLVLRLINNDALLPFVSLLLININNLPLVLIIALPDDVNPKEADWRNSRRPKKVIIVRDPIVTPLRDNVFQSRNVKLLLLLL